jgi:hypothetical protein
MVTRTPFGDWDWMTTTFIIPAEHLRYRTLYHDPSVDVNPDRQKLFDDGYLRFESDGLINLKYRPNDLQLKPLYTHSVVELTEDIIWT